MEQQHKTVFSGHVVKVTVGQVALPNGGTMQAEIVHHPGGAAVVALDAHQRVCLLRQYRPVINDWIWELPAGKIDNQDTPLATAQRELEEEAGVVATEWQSLGSVVSSPGVFSEVVHLYKASGISFTAHAHEEHEVLEVHWIPFDEAFSRARDGEISDAKTVAGLFRAKTSD